jgi:hypothetical protein
MPPMISFLLMVMLQAGAESVPEGKLRCYSVGTQIGTVAARGSSTRRDASKRRFIRCQRRGTEGNRATHRCSACSRCAHTCAIQRVARLSRRSTAPTDACAAHGRSNIRAVGGAAGLISAVDLDRRYGKLPLGRYTLTVRLWHPETSEPLVSNPLAFDWPIR